MMTDADPLEAEVKRAMIAQAGESTLLVATNGIFVAITVRNCTLASSGRLAM